MPELPEVETVVRSVAAHLAGRRIVSTSFTSRFVTPGSRAKLSQRLSGRRIESVTRRGKFILIALDEGTLTVHLGMTGKLHPLDRNRHRLIRVGHAARRITQPRQDVLDAFCDQEVDAQRI